MPQNSSCQYGHTHSSSSGIRHSTRHLSFHGFQILVRWFVKITANTDENDSWWIKNGRHVILTSFGPDSRQLGLPNCEIILSSILVAEVYLKFRSQDCSLFSSFSALVARFVSLGSVKPHLQSGNLQQFWYNIDFTSDQEYEIKFA
jgi:hypothetical protein